MLVSGQFDSCPVSVIPDMTKHVMHGLSSPDNMFHRRKEAGCEDTGEEEAKYVRAMTMPVAKPSELSPVGPRISMKYFDIVVEGQSTCITPKDDIEDAVPDVIFN